MSWRWLAGIGWLALLLAAPLAQAASTAESLALAAQAVEAGRYQAALDELEQLADTGVAHPDVAFTRGVAYLRRASSDKAEPGDLGQAAAAFRETLLLRPSDAQAGRGLEEARMVVARKATSEETTIEAVGLGQRLLLMLDAWIVLILACAGSLMCALGLAFFRLGRDTKRTGGAIAAAVGGTLTLLCLPLWLLVTRAQNSTDIAIVIAARAPLLDAEGRAKKGLAPLPEGTEIHIARARGNLVQLSTGVPRGGETWMRRSQLRVLATPRPATK